MSGGAACRCGKREAWRVMDYRCNHSAFNGYRFERSDYSALWCDPAAGGCDARWRTKAAYVDDVARRQIASA